VLVSRENGLWQRVQHHVQRIGCQHVQWPISCADDDFDSLLLLLLLLLVLVVLGRAVKTTASVCQCVRSASGRLQSSHTPRAPLRSACSLRPTATVYRIASRRFCTDRDRQSNASLYVCLPVCRNNPLIQQKSALRSEPSTLSLHGRIQVCNTLGHFALYTPKGVRMEGGGSARPRNVETTGARVSFRPRNIFPKMSTVLLFT